MTDHTQGPWTYFKSENDGDVCWEVFPEVDGEPNGIPIAEVYTEADAILIASAPKLHQRAPLDDEARRLRKLIDENAKLTRQIAILESQQTFCPDCQDKVRRKPCQRCTVQRLQKALLRSADGHHSLSEDPIHQMSLFATCKHYKCKEAQSALEGVTL